MRGLFDAGSAICRVAPRVRRNETRPRTDGECRGRWWSSDGRRVRPPDRAEPRNGRAAVTSRADDVTVEIACARVPGGALAARRSQKMQIPFYCNHKSFFTSMVPTVT